MNEEIFFETRNEIGSNGEINCIYFETIYKGNVIASGSIYFSQTKSYFEYEFVSVNKDYDVFIIEKIKTIQRKFNIKEIVQK